MTRLVGVYKSRCTLQFSTKDTATRGSDSGYLDYHVDHVDNVDNDDHVDHVDDDKGQGNQGLEFRLVIMMVIVDDHLSSLIESKSTSICSVWSGVGTVLGGTWGSSSSQYSREGKPPIWVTS